MFDFNDNYSIQKNYIISIPTNTDNSQTDIYETHNLDSKRYYQHESD